MDTFDGIYGDTLYTLFCSFLRYLDFTFVQAKFILLFILFFLRLSLSLYLEFRFSQQYLFIRLF